MSTLYPNFNPDSDPNPCSSPQMVVQLVGIDAIMLMEGRELVFLKLLDAEASKILQIRDRP